MTAAEIFSRLGAEIAARPAWWIVLALSLVALTVCSMACFERQWLRALIAGTLAAEGAVMLCSGLVG